MKKHTMAIVFVLVSGLLLGACGKGGAYSPDTSPPEVVGTVPEADAVDVAVGATITATFSEPMKDASLTPASFIVTGPSGTVGGDIITVGAAATFTPSAELLSGAVYTATITTDAQDLAGNALAAAYSWRFTTLSEAQDIVAPDVLSRSPEIDATGVNVNSAITVTFSEPMLASSITATTFRVNDGGSDIAGDITSAGATATFTPGAALTGNHTYTVTITTGARDVAGNPLAAGHVWSFTTAASSGGIRILYNRYGDLLSVNEDGTGVVGIAYTGAQEIYRGISPSGKVIYSANSALYSVNADGTGAVLLDAAGGQVFVGFSSTGRVVYTMNGDLYAINTDGTGKATLANSADDESNAVIGPAGRIVYTRIPSAGTDRAICSVNDDGTGAVVLDGTAGMKIVARVSAAGQVFYTRDQSGSSDLYVINTDGTGLGAIAATASYSEWFAGQAPDGTVAYYSCLGGGCSASLVTAGTAAFSLGSMGSLKGITADNRFIVQQGVGGQFDLKSFTAGGAVFTLAADPSAMEVFHAVHPDNRVIYRVLVGGTQTDIFSVKSDGTGPATLANSTENETFLGITPTGRVVYATGSSPFGLTNIYSINADGTDPLLLHGSASAKMFQGFSSSGKVLYLDAVNPSLGSDLFIVDHDGSAPVNLTNNPALTGGLAFFSSLP